MLWAFVVFWISDGYCCQRDIFRFANIKVRYAETFYDVNVVNNIFYISITMTREQSRNPSLSTLSFYIDIGMTWWAPIPDSSKAPQRCFLRKNDFLDLLFFES